MSRSRVWKETPSGWWRHPDAATYARWRKARDIYFCYDCRHVIKKGDMYVESVAAPWHDIVGVVIRDGKHVRVWTHGRLCGNHPDWGPPVGG